MKAGPPGRTGPRGQEDDTQAWQEVVGRFAPYVHAVAQASELTEEEAESAFDEVFARLWSRLGGLEDDEALRAFVVTHTERIVAVRRRALAEPPSAPAEDALARLREALAVSEASRRLTTLQRELLHRRFARREDDDAIAAALGIPEETVAVQLARARRRLRTRLRRP